MLKLASKVDCSGCNACGDICPNGSLTFKTDQEGFWYPKINMDTCIDCSLCEKVCPIITPADFIDRYKEPRIYAAYTKDDLIRLDSTSGGIHSMLAKIIYKQHGYVGGAIYNEDHTVSHIASNDDRMLPKIRSSKYLQSDMNGQYTEVKTLLRKGETVFYCAAPCQIQALYKYLRKDYDNLITCDFICRGVNSPKVFLSYMDMLEKRYKSKATDIKFKNKKWGWHNFSMRVNFENGKEYCEDRDNDLYFIGYLQWGNFARPSCYDCKFKGFPQKADITLADFWGIEHLDKDMDQDKGTSLVMINSDKGQELFDKVKDELVWKEFTMEDAQAENQAMVTSIKMLDEKRDRFFRALDELPFDKVAKMFFPLKSKFTKSLNKLKTKLYRMKEPIAIAMGLGLSPYAWFSFLKLNFFNKHIQRSGVVGLLFPKRYFVIEQKKGSLLNLSAPFNLGTPQVKGSKIETRLLLEENSILTIKRASTLYAGGFIRLIKKSELILDGVFLNEKVQIICGERISIGYGSVIGRDVVIRSYDGHTVVEPEYKISAPISIGKHVWIGQGATVLKGVTIGDGAIIAAGAIVTKDIPARCLAIGVPAKVAREDVDWK